MKIAPGFFFAAMKSRLKQKKRRPLSLGRIILYIVLGVLALTVLQVLSLRWFNPRTTAYILAEKINGEYEVPMFVSWIPRDRLSSNLARAVLTAEDQRFYDHNGFDWVEIQNALEKHEKGGNLRGASTISMQLARNLFLWSGRSWIRKGLEAYYTFLLELFLSKNRILEIYLNVVEFGPGIFGASAACDHYYKSPGCRLSKDQAASLAMILPAPKHWSPFRAKGRLAAKKRRILKQMNYMVLPDWSEKEKRKGV